MYAFPIKMDKQNSTLAQLFGKAKYFAFYKNKEVYIEKNLCSDGEEVALWLKQKGVNNLIIKEIGSNAYKKCKEFGLNLFLVDEKEIEIPQICEIINDKKIVPISEIKMQEIISKHEKKHNHSHNK